MAQSDSFRLLAGSSMNSDDAVEVVANSPDVLSRTNMRISGSQTQEATYGTNIESTNLLAGTLPAGINIINGGGKYDDTGQILIARYNAAGNCELLLYNFSTNSYEVIYEDVTDSGGATLLPLNPQEVVLSILINSLYAVWWAKGLEVGYTNLQTLASGGYGTVLWEDLSLLKLQNPFPILPVPNATSPDVITSGFGSDAGQPANYLYSHLPQFIAQGVNADYNYTAWGTWGKRFTPYQENTPILGATVAENNYVVVAVYIWSTRIATLNVAVTFDDSGQFYICKTVTTSYIYALPNTGVDVASEIYEAYDPVANIYYFVFYNNTVLIPVSIAETALLYDYIWPSNAGAQLNGNIIGIGDYQTLYPRPSIPVTVAGVAYNPNITIPPSSYPTNPLAAGQFYPGESNSGQGDHRRTIIIILSGEPALNDQVVIITTAINNALSSLNYTYPVTAPVVGNLLAVVQAISQNTGGSYIYYPTAGTYPIYIPGEGFIFNPTVVAGSYAIIFTGQPYQELTTFAIDHNYGGATLVNSIPECLDNAVYQGAIEWLDDKMRPFPLTTDNTYIVTTKSYAQQNGMATQISVTINTTTAPAGAMWYQILITKPQVLKVLDTIACTITYKGGWNARTNSPTLAINSGNIGDTYEIINPASPVTGLSDYTNLGQNATYNTGDYITNVGASSGGANIGQYYTVLSQSFGNIAGIGTSGGILVFSLNSLALLNADFAKQNVNTNLVYSFTDGDRCTLHYWIGSLGGVSTFTITPGTGYTNNTYTGVSLTGGTGSGAIATVVVSGNVVTSVTITTPGINYTANDFLTGTVTGGTGWGITVLSLTTTGINYFNMPCIDLAVLGYDAGSYLLKVENSAALTFSNGHIYYNSLQIDARNVFLRIYTPAPLTNNVNETVWYEIGNQYNITGGVIQQQTIIINDGGAYYKTRTFPDAIKPYTNTPVQVLATDLNYSDFYPSAYYSFGRARTYYDVLEQSEQQANIITSQPYISGSKINGLNRFYPSLIYGNADGQTSSSKGGIQIMWQRGSILWVLQERGVFKCPVNIAYTQVNSDSILESNTGVLLNLGRYEDAGVGIALTKCFCTRVAVLDRNLVETAYFVDPISSLPFRITEAVECIAGKMSKFFKGLLQNAYEQGQGLLLIYNDFYEEATLCVQPPSSGVFAFPFTSENWNAYNNYNIVGTDVSAETNGSHSTVSYNSSSGIATYTPSANYYGSDQAQFSFTPPGGMLTTLNVCLLWIQGNTTVNPFTFLAITGQPLSTVVYSNVITVSGPNIAVAISISGAGGQYSINGGAWTSSAGTVVSGNTVQVRTTTSESNSTAVSAVLTISGTSGTFTATTLASGAGNYNIQTSYGVTVTAIADGTTTGTPNFSSQLPLAPGGSIYAAYTTITSSNVLVTLTGMPVIPGSTFLGLLVNGVAEGPTPLITGPGTYTLTFTTSPSSPTPIEVYVFT